MMELESWSNFHLQKAIDVVDMVLGFLSFGTADPQESVYDYVTKTLTQMWEDPNIKVMC